MSRKAIDQKALSADQTQALIAILQGFTVGAQLSVNGISSFTFDVNLARNALVRKYDLVLQARSAIATLVNTVAQVRVTETSAASTGADMAIVLDFGTPRTVSKVQVPSGLSIVRVTPWMGTAFGPKAVFTAELQTVLATMPAEIRTERLLVEVKGKRDGAALASEMAVSLPEAPSDLEVRIDGGAPVVSLPGPAQPGTETALSDQTWNKDGERIIHLAEALGKLTGDPTNSEMTTFKVVLNSRVPGELSIHLASPPELSFVRRVLFSSETSKELLFAEEGSQDIPITGLPTNPSIQEVRFTAVGTFPPERTIPPVGPDNAGIADLLLDSDRAACVRLRSSTGLAELTGIRLPLLPGSTGAEMRILLWTNKEGAVEPVEPMPDGVSEPVTLPAGAGSEVWYTFPFKRPVAINSQNPPWAVLSISRGEVVWKLAAAAGISDPVYANVILRGAPTGPWRPLPFPFQSATSVLGSIRGRMRLSGHAPKDDPMAALIVKIASHAPKVEVEPTAKGSAARLVFSSPARVTSPVLRVTSRVPGNVTVRDLDVVSTT